MIDYIDWTEETVMKHSGACPDCGGHHAWFGGVPNDEHYAVYDCGTWAYEPTQIGLAEAIEFAAENGQSVYHHMDRCGKNSKGCVWSFTETFPGAQEHYINFGDKKAKVTFGQNGKPTIHWTTPPSRRGPDRRRKRG